MWQNMMEFNLSPLNLVIRGAVVYLSVLILFRLSGKRQIGQMGATEFVAVLLISNAVQNAMNGGDNSLSGGLLLASVLIFLSASISLFTYKSKLMRTVFEGTPTLLINHGKIIQSHLLKERMNESEIHTIMREHGFNHLNEIDTMIIEADGKFTIRKADKTAAPN